MSRAASTSIAVRRVLVTGGGGFIGSHLTESLLARGVAVRVLDSWRTGRRENLAGLDVDIVDGDVRDPATVARAVAGCDAVFHLAALVSVPESLAQPVLNQAINVDGTLNVFEAARQAGVRRVVYASSAAVYGNRPGLPKRETDPVELLTPYALAKYVNELTAETYRAAYGTETVGLRCMNVFGPRQDPGSPYSGVLSIFCRQALAGAPLTIDGDGKQTRDFVYVSDVVEAMWLAATVRAPAHAVYNVGRGEQTSLNAIARQLGAALGRRVPVAYGSPRAGDIRHSVADISRASADLGYRPQVTVADGLAQTLTWFRAGQGAAGAPRPNR